MNKYNRKQLRLYGYDYSLNGAYFITICTEKRKKILCDINVGEGLSPLPIINLSDIGKEVQRSVEFINQNTPNVTIDKYVIMPNHIHMIVIIDNEWDGAGTPPLQSVVGRIKSYTTNKYGRPLWQRSYYDHIIRDENDYINIWNYIDTNPSQWAHDEYY
ncbi:MAG: transposase [Oscillospiraceae bacterium]|nr:transposase [Oscillospiraceae bacterium]